MDDMTQRYYEENTKPFVESTLLVDMGGLYCEFLPYIPAGGHILDLGCGSGRDSRVFLDGDFLVTALDGSPALCKVAEQLIGQPVLCMDFLDISFEQEFDGVWACASLLHLASEQIPTVLNKIARALKSGGVLYLSFKKGCFEGFRGGRYYTDLTEEAFDEMIAGVRALSIIKTWTTVDARPDVHNEWLNAILRAE